MERTPFAGLTALDEDDPITIDGGSFGIRNPRTTDTLLRVGAVTHHHDAHAPVPNPHVALTGFVSSGGSISGSSTFALTYTVLDRQGGETAAAPPLILSTGGQTPAPTISPSATVVTSAGILPDGDYYYALTYTDGAGGETTIGPTTLITVPPGFASASIVLSDLAQELAPNGVAVEWRLWRSYEGEDWHLVSQSGADSFDDAGFDPPDNPARPPEQNTTAGTFALVVTLPTAAGDPSLASATAINLYLAPDANFTNPCFYEQLPVASAGATIVIPIDTITEGSPPPVSLSKPGANQINPDTDILDWHWKRPVVTMTALPSGAQGDVRLALDTGHPWAVISPSGAVDFHGWTDLLLLASGVIADIDIGLGVAGSGGVGLVDPVTYVEFAASAGATSVSVTNLGGGSAQVRIPAGAGGAGPSGPGSIAIAASAGASAVNPDYYAEFAGSGGIGVAVQSLGGGSARILIGQPAETQTNELNWRGAYASNTSYLTNDVVLYGGHAHRARQTIPSGGVSPAGLAPSMTGSAAAIANGGTVTGTVPATTQVGDIILVALSQQGSAPAVPAGYTLAGSGTATNVATVGLTVCYKVATQADIGSTLSLVTAGGFPSCVHIRSYSSDGVDTTAAASTGVPAAVVSSIANELQVTFFAALSGSTVVTASLAAGGSNQFTTQANFGGVGAEDFPLALVGSRSVGGAFSLTGSQDEFENVSVLLKPKTAWDSLATDLIAASGGASAVNPANYVEFTASGGASVAVQSLGGGSARVVIGPGDGGVATLSGGSAVVTDPSITATVRVMLTAQDNNTTGALRVSARTAGQNFTITSSNAGDTGLVAYQFFGS